MSILTGAYGRTYKTLKDAVLDFEGGLDFRTLTTRQYTSVRDYGKIDLLLGEVKFMLDDGSVETYFLDIG